MNSRSPPTISDVKRSCTPSLWSATIIVPFLLTGSFLGRYFLGKYGGLGLLFAGFLLGAFLEINLICRRFGISRTVMFCCIRPNLRGKVESFANDILKAYSLLRRKENTDYWFELKLSRLVFDLFNGLNALSHYPAIEGFHQWEEKFVPLVYRTMSLANNDDLTSGDIEEELLEVRVQAQMYLRSILETTRRARF